MAARRLVGLTAAYNAFEALLALWSGFAARSVALCGFGFDSVIECAAAAVVLWRFSKKADALLMVPWLVKEGIEGLRGRDSCRP